MTTTTVAGTEIEVNEDGFMLNPDQWTPEIAAEIAREAGIEAQGHQLLLHGPQQAERGRGQRADPDHVLHHHLGGLPLHEHQGHRESPVHPMAQWRLRSPGSPASLDFLQVLSGPPFRFVHSVCVDTQVQIW